MDEPDKTECMIVTWCGAEISVHPNVMKRLGLSASQEIDRIWALARRKPRRFNGGG